MSTVQLPGGRYGRSADERADHKLKIIGSVLGAVLLVLIGWFAYHYVGGTKISAEVITFETSDTEVKVQLEVHKDADTSGYCTIRSQAENGAEVGRADFRFDRQDSRVNQVVTLRTTSRGTTAELLGCHAD